MKKTCLIRTYKPTDCDAVVKLFYDSVHHIPLSYYTKEQKDAWAPKCPVLEEWQQRLKPQYVRVAFYEEELVGFASIIEDCVDYLYVHKDYQGQHIATQLMDEIEAYAIKHGYSTLYTDASFAAQAFFETREYHVMYEQVVERSGVVLKNLCMKKHVL